ncbi:AcrR family transcriptional regulator [Mesorhizobium soli]|uniref:CerR family C-terminal domain-containing protein n=1 Tax=Pseudaminobacter soli (ex Li et al. 2025) TaxID=1295366 RepID=UPI002474183C|nr:CerR family C-terminal domain-containing protein [Mesorhizobium soli]MDH6230604.1 AcrR family transcriptional regulator [Mesorhizobium soli]
MKIAPENKTASGDQTRIALVHAALHLFGSKGFDGTSTREIAALAKANIGSIAYHFGGKEGLRLGAADYIVETIQGLANQALSDFVPISEPADTAEAAQRQLHAALDRMVHFIVARPEAGEIVQFMLRELAHPTAALDRIYGGVFEPLHRRLCAIWEAATGEPAEADSTKLTVFTVIGQVIYFRIGQEAVKRRMGWAAIGSVEADAVAAITGRNLDAILASRKSHSQ